MTNLKGELSKKDTEIFRLQSQLETLQKQASDRHQHIKVLKETVAAKEQHSASLQVSVVGSMKEGVRCLVGTSAGVNSLAIFSRM